VPEGNVRQVNADERRAVAAGELLGDGAPPIASLRREAFVAQRLGHQAVPQVADAERDAFRMGISEKP
jgi:hypothetical protein